MKKFLSLVLALAMMVSVCAFANAEGFNGEIKVWVAEAVVDFTNQQVEAFKAAHPEYAGFIVTVQAVGEGDAASNMITDVEGGAGVRADEDAVADCAAAHREFVAPRLRRGGVAVEGAVLNGSACHRHTAAAGLADADAIA